MRWWMQLNALLQPFQIQMPLFDGLAKISVFDVDKQVFEQTRDRVVLIDEMLIVQLRETVDCDLALSPCQLAYQALKDFVPSV